MRPSPVFTYVTCYNLRLVVREHDLYKTYVKSNCHIWPVRPKNTVIINKRVKKNAQIEHTKWQTKQLWWKMRWKYQKHTFLIRSIQEVLFLSSRCCIVCSFCLFILKSLKWKWSTFWNPYAFVIYAKWWAIVYRYRLSNLCACHLNAWKTIHFYFVHLTLCIGSGVCAQLRPLIQHSPHSFI